jgi:predicted MFS family arabinose efflux permease
MLHQVGAFLGSWLGGVFVEATGSYDGMWMLDMVLGGTAAALALTIRESGAAVKTAPAVGRPAPVSAS